MVKRYKTKQNETKRKRTRTRNKTKQTETPEITEWTADDHGLDGWGLQIRQLGITDHIIPHPLRLGLLDFYLTPAFLLLPAPPLQEIMWPVPLPTSFRSPLPGVCCLPLLCKRQRNSRPASLYLPADLWLGVCCPSHLCKKW